MLRTMTGNDIVEEYYRVLDEDEYGRLQELLTEDFVHQRPDMTIDGRDEFLNFMANGRPEKTTTHEVNKLHSTNATVVVEGTLYKSSGEKWFSFADVHEIVDSQINMIRTYTG